jgi:hypothetical protein
MRVPIPDRHRLLLVASADGSLYYGDAAMKFTIQKQTY